MKIDTLTTYDVYNYGASLQAYALQQYILSLGYDSEIIRYQPEYLRRKYDCWWVNPESKASKYFITRMIYRVAKTIQRLFTLGRKRKFDVFNHSYLKETTEYRTHDELVLHPPIADMYVCGSDQIWNVLYDAGRDPVFFLEFVPQGRKRISYAASFSYLNIDKDNFNRIRESLKKFYAVSVRETQGLQILNEMEIKGQVVLDPVFLHNADFWRRFAEQGHLKKNISNQKYILVYDFENNELLRASAIGYAKKHTLSIFSITDTYSRRYADKNFSKAGPIEFVQLIDGCEAFFSNSFHGTVFSIIFHKPFFVFKRNRHAVNSRMESLLSLFDMENRMIENKQQFEWVASISENWEDKEIIKQEQLKKSESYLINAIKQL